MKKVNIIDTIKFFKKLDLFLIENFEDEFELHLGVIGGTYLELFSLRESTKDIDLVLLTQVPNKITEYFKKYMVEKDIEIDFGPPGIFQSMLLNEDMFSRFSFILPNMKTGRFRKYTFKKLKLYLIQPQYFMLVKLEAGTKRGERDINDAKAIQKHFGIKEKEFIEVLEEYDVEIDMVPGLQLTIDLYKKDNF